MGRLISERDAQRADRWRDGKADRIAATQRFRNCRNCGLADHMPPLYPSRTEPAEDEVRQLIVAVRQQPAASAVTIVVGGHGFSGQPDLWREVGADGYGQDAIEAVRLIGELKGV